MSKKSLKAILARQKLNFRQFVKKHPKLTIIFLLILLVALFFRTYHYFDRLSVYADSALFVQTAYYAFKNFKVPQIGPFAQAPFFTGPWWLWILEIMFIFPFGILTPWYFMLLASLIFIILIYIAGKEIGGKRLGLLASLLAAISTAQIDNSFTTWNAAADPYLGLLSILFLLKYRKESKPLHIFLLGFCVSLAISIHFQTALLFSLVLVALFTVKPRVKNFLALTLGLVIPLLPFLYFDLKFNWFETKRIVDYVFIGQSRIYVPNRWLTYAGVYWPESWAWIIGGKTWIAYIVIGLLAMFTLLRLKGYKKHKNYYIMAISFVLSVIMLRYYRGEKFFYYSNFAHAFVLLLTAWVIVQVYRSQRIVGILLALIIVIFSVTESIDHFTPPVVTYDQVNKFVAEIYQKYPHATFDIYECPFNGSIISTPVSYKMYFDGRNAVNGVKIGVCNAEGKLTWREVQSNETNKEYGYINKSTPVIYKGITEWWKDNPPSRTD